MKKFLSTLAVVLITCQTFAADLFCTPSGGVIPSGPLSLLYGTSFYYAYSPSDLMHELVTNPNITGNVNIFFGAGDYYETFDFSYLTMPSAITSISLYGGFKGTEAKPVDLTSRDPLSNETVFHSTTTSAITYSCSWFTGHCNVIDGITITSDNVISSAALELYVCDFVVAHCKIRDFHTTGPLIWLESGNSYKRFVNTVIENNEADYLMSAYCNVDMLNLTIADNKFYTYFIYGSLTNNNYNIRNSIIWGSGPLTSYNMYGLFNVSYSIVQYYDSWMVDDYTNHWSTDPLFTYATNDPHTCTTLSIARNNGYIPYLLFYPITSLFDFSQYDVNMLSRFYNPLTYDYVDIGAYQHETYSGSNYNVVHPEENMQSPQRIKQNNLSSVSVSTEYQYNLLGQPVEENYHGIVIKNGQKVLQ